MPLNKVWAGLHQCLPYPRNRSSPHHEDAAMRPRLADRTKSEKHHQDYLDKLAVPSLQAVEHIARVQEENEKEIEKKYERVHEGGEGDGKPIEADRRDKAASTIQV